MLKTGTGLSVTAKWLLLDLSSAGNSYELWVEYFKTARGYWSNKNRAEVRGRLPLAKTTAGIFDVLKAFLLNADHSQCLTGWRN